MDSFGNHICGLFYTDRSHSYGLKRSYLPPVKLESHTTINPVCFTTQLTQTYQNPSDQAIPQLRYTFPLYDGVAVNGYTISYADKVLMGIVKQKDDAKQTYQAAVDRGETAGLLESLPAGVFGVTLGNIPGKTDIVVEITYCGELKHDAAIDGLRYMLPTSIAPRYGSYPGEVLNSHVVAKGGISITVDIDMATSNIRKVQSPSHPIAVSMGGLSTTEGSEDAPFRPSQASAALKLGSAELADDFVLQLLIDDINKPQAILETHPAIPNQRAIMTTLVPKFTLDPAHPEIVFIADQSGSMTGTKNEALKSALNVFLKSLPLGVRFNICAFGNNFKFVWPKSQAYNEANVNTALSFVDSFTASYGGTEILKPITAAFEKKLKDLPLEVMLLTDGAIWAEDAVFSYINEQVRDKDVDARVFALGIGSDVSHTLVEGVARAGNGFAQFVTQNEDTDQKVIRMLKGALYAHTNDYSLEVHYDEKNSEDMSDEDDFEIVEKVNDCLKIADNPDDDESQKQKSGVVGKVKSFFDNSDDMDQPIKTEGEAGADRYAHLPDIETPKLLHAPNRIPSLFPFNRTTVYLLLGPESAQKEVTSITLRATSAQGPLELTIPVNYTDCDGVPTIHRLAARKAIQDLEEGRGWIQAAKTSNGASAKTKYESRFDEIVERECVRLGEQFQVAGKWTSFVAIEDKEGEKMNVESEEVEQEKVEQGNIQLDKGISHARMSRKSPTKLSRKSPMKRMMHRAFGNPAYGQRYVASTPTPGPFPFSTQQFGHAGSAGSRSGPTGGLFGSSRTTQPVAPALMAPQVQVDQESMEQYGKEMQDAAAMPLPDEDDPDWDYAFGNMGNTHDQSSEPLFSSPFAARRSNFFGFGSTLSNTSAKGQLEQNTTGDLFGSSIKGLPESNNIITGSGSANSLFAPPQSNIAQTAGFFASTNSNNPGQGLFGSTSNNTTGGGPFGGANSHNPGSGLLGSTSNNTTGGGLFGSTNSINPGYGHVLFGSTSNNTRRGGLFGSPSNAQSTTKEGNIFSANGSEGNPSTAHNIPISLPPTSTPSSFSPPPSSPLAHSALTPPPSSSGPPPAYAMAASSEPAKKKSTGTGRGLGVGGALRHRRVVPDDQAVEAAADAGEDMIDFSDEEMVPADGGNSGFGGQQQTMQQQADMAQPMQMQVASVDSLQAPALTPASTSGAAAAAASTTATGRTRGPRTEKARHSVGGKPPRMQLASKPASRTPTFLRDEEDTDDDNSTDLQATRTMHTLISLQTFSGAWEWSPALFAALKLSETEIGEAWGSNESEEVKATALAVAFLEKRVAGKKEVWEMVVRKARGWMAGQVGGEGEGEVQGVVEMARGYV